MLRAIDHSWNNCSIIVLRAWIEVKFRQEWPSHSKRLIMENFPPKTFTQQPAEISKRLDQIEIELVHIDMDKKRNPLRILTMMDELAVLISTTGKSPDSLKAERSQFEQIKTGLIKRAGQIVRASGGSRSFKQQREQHHPPAEYEWWYLDDYLHIKQKRFLRKILIWMIVGIAILIGLSLIYQRFLAPDPILIARLNHQSNAIEAMRNQQYQQGLNEANLALANGQDDTESLILKGLALLKLGKTNEADQVFLIAQKHAGSIEDFYLVRSMEWLSINEPEPAVEDGQKAIEINPQSMEGYWYKGKAEILLGQYTLGRDDLNQAAKLAEQEDRMEIVVQIKVELANLAQTIH
jgi:tetratricopeptide (TPR) repeat protein